MAVTPPDVQAVLQQLEAILVRWHKDGTLGEVAVIVGGNQYLPLERPTVKHPPVRREQDALSKIDHLQG